MMFLAKYIDFFELGSMIHGLPGCWSETSVTLGGAAQLSAAYINMQ